MDTNSQYIIEELLIRYCEGKVSEEEATYVKQWMAASKKNRQMAQRINRICLAADTLELQDTLDMARAFRKVRKHKNSQRIRTARQWIQRAAAILFLPLLGLWLMQQYGESNEEPQLVEIQTHPGMSSSFTLPDGTLVYLNSASSLTYPVRFNGNTRNVSLKGEAYFEVSKDPQKRFIVSTPHNTCVEVLGTHFDLEAYENQKYISATLLEGKINFIYQLENKTKGIFLNPGNKVIYNTETNEVRLYRTSGICETGWTKGEIILENTPLEEALHQLGKHFHADFIISNSKLKEYSFTGVFANQSLERVLDKFKLSSRIKWRYLNEGENTKQKMQIEIY